MTAPAAPRRVPALAARVPLRVRLVAVLVVLVALGLLLAGLAAAQLLRSYQVDRLDQQLATTTSSAGLRDLLRGDRGRFDGPRLPQQYYVAVLDDGGAVQQVFSTPAGAADRYPDLGGVTVEEAAGRNAAPRTVAGVPGGADWRAVVLPLSDGSGSIAIAADLQEVDRTVTVLLLRELLVGSVVLLLLAGVGYLVVKRSLRGLVAVEEAAAAVAAGDLGRRVPARDPRTEVGSLATSFNRMVEQVQSAFATRAASQERLRRFVADAGHELRTPLTSIRGFAELHRQGAVREPDDVARLMGRIESESKRMGQLVEDLLTLARLDEQRPLDNSVVDLAVLAADAVHDARAVCPDRVVDLVAAPAPVLVSGDESRLRQVLANLVSNALTHAPAPARTSVRALLSPGGDEALLEVCDDGPGMSAEDAGRIFERFYRADASRTRMSGGAGLGLSIASSLVAAHGGRIDLETSPGRGACFRVLLPAVGS